MNTTAIVVYIILYVLLTTGMSMEKDKGKPKECFWGLILATIVFTIVCGKDNIFASICAWIATYIAYKAIEK
jgi:hypothetical protein